MSSRGLLFWTRALGAAGTYRDKAEHSQHDCVCVLVELLQSAVPVRSTSKWTQTCSYTGVRARREEIFRGLTGKRKVTQGHLDQNVAKGISDKHSPENEHRANRIWKTGREQTASQRFLETVLLLTVVFVCSSRAVLWSVDQWVWWGRSQLCGNFRSSFCIVLRELHML